MALAGRNIRGGCAGMIEFTVTEWAAWAPGLQTREAWLAWAGAPAPPQGEDSPALAEVPALQRRRIDRLGRMAIQAAYWCDEAVAAGAPLVFASRHGDVQRSLELLRQQAHGEPMSPTAFGLSVHNAIAALYTIVRGERGNYLALAAGRASVETALLEAAGLLADGASEVRVVVYDATLPADYGPFADEPEASYAWCWRVRAAAAAGARLSLAWMPALDADAPAPASTLPAGLAPLQFLLAAAQQHEQTGDGIRWRWRRHD